jgi:integrase
MKMSNTTWTLPKYKQEESIPFVPDESELLQLIAGAHSRKLAAYLQLLKDTWPDPTEALRLEYGEVNGNIVSINHPVKDHMCRQIEVSDECVAMLNSLGVQSGRYFKMTYKAVYGSFKRLREKVAKNRGDPRFLQITLNSFRHWGGTMLAYYSNGNVLHVKKNLGHRRVENTMKYIDMAKALRKKSCEFESVSVTSAEEILAMGKSGWEKYDEAIFQGITYHFYKRPKRFGYADYKVGSETLNFYKQ